MYWHSGLDTTMIARLSLRSPITPHAFVAGLLLTIALFTSALSWIDPSAITHESTPDSSQRPSAEEIRFVTAVVRATVAAPITSRVKPVLPQRSNDSTSAQPVANVVVPPSAPSEQANPATTALAPQASRLTLPPPSWHNRDFSLPYLRDPLARQSPLTAAERDSAARAFARLAAARIPTAEEKDAAQRELSDPGTIPGRRVGEQGGRGGVSGSVPLPLFSSGPSRATRKRDSIAYAENRERLARLAARAQARRDSAPY